MNQQQKETLRLALPMPASVGGFMVGNGAFGNHPVFLFAGAGVLLVVGCVFAWTFSKDRPAPFDPADFVEVERPEREFRLIKGGLE